MDCTTFQRSYNGSRKTTYMEETFNMRPSALREIERRFNLVMENVDMSDEDISFGRSGSLISFCAGLCLIGTAGPGMPGPEEEVLKKYPWMDAFFVEPCLTLSEFQGHDYDDLLKTLHEQMLNEVQRQQVTIT